MQNLIPLSFLDEAKSTEISQLSSEDLRSLMERLTEMAECLKKRKTLLEDGLNLKFSQMAQDKLKLDGRDTGTIRFDDGAYTIVAEMPKKVVWDQEKLETIIDKIPAGERKHYAKATYAIDERKYLSWSDDLRKFFDEARSVHLGKPKFQIIDGGNDQ
ncbi:MAG: hypothetical protein KF820_01420 [Candidatus Paracaedibacteraceae bacterium]|nr:hypothetical protein [Candidatus Paracaedibacteraceae bacterium]